MFFSCTKNGENIDGNQPGIIPSSTAQVIDVFELKYGEVKEYNYDSKVFKFSITDVEDNRQRCDVIYSSDADFFNKIRIHAYLHLEMDEKIIRLKISSKTCGTIEWDVQQIWDEFEIWQQSEFPNPHYFQNMFVWTYGEGILIKDTPLSIYMAKAEPSTAEKNDNTKKNMYKFIFIITDQKAE